VDFAGPYFLRGYRLAVRENSDVVDFSGLRGNQIIAVDINDSNAAEIAVAEATEDNARIQIFQAVDAAYSILVDNNADAAFGDSVWLIPQLEANPGMLRITDQWYTRTFVGMAVPRNDIDFRLLVEHTIQDLVLDGTLANLLTPVTPAGDIPRFEVWPGVRG
jgi:ABC-type amino acid transport substrate-binding protein